METTIVCRQQNNREKILETARDLFYRIGYQSTSVDDILRECGVAKSNFYYHFRTKEDLAFEVLETRIQEYETLLLNSLQNKAMRPAERMDAFLEQINRVHATMQHASGCPFGNFAAALAIGEGRPDERFRMRLSALFRRMAEAMTECLTEGAILGEFRNDIAPATLADLLIASFQGLMILAKTHQDVAMLSTGFSVVTKLIAPR